ncbi:MAG: sugar transferase [Deltaproteobacteria bacterium]|nr:sugar transferase [Deltaproteobacteria bacterium]
MNPAFDRMAPTPFSLVHLFADLVMLAGMAWSLEPTGISTGLEVALMVLLSLGWLTASAALRAYQASAHRHASDQFSVWAMQTVVACGCALLLSVLAHGAMPPSETVFLVAAGLGLTRTVLVEAEHLFGHPSQTVLIVGVGPLAWSLAGRLGRGRGMSRVAGFIPLDGETPSPALAPRVLGPAGSLAHTLSEHSVDEVYVAGNAVTQTASMQQAVTVCEELGMPFALPAHALCVERAQALTLDRKDLGFVHHITAQPMPMARGVKRLFDVMASAVALLVLSPLLLLVAFLIKVTSAGPVFFGQKRVGMHGRPFTMLKFRSMVVDAEGQQEKLAALNEQDGPVFKIRNDPRITSVGRFMRRYSVDELPQLINILRGDMSVVGPRPPVPKEVAQYEPWQRRRLSVRPGLTCHWQVSGRNNISFDQWMLLDLRYIDQWSFFTDLKLIARTIPAVFSGRGAS